jgi:hypothetical protein
MSSSSTWKDEIALRRLVTKAADRSVVEIEIRAALSDIIEWRRSIAREPIGGRRGGRLVESPTVRRATERAENERGRGDHTERRSRRGDGDRARSKRRQAESPETPPGKEPPADDPETAGSQ